MQGKPVYPSSRIDDKVDKRGILKCLVVNMAKVKNIKRFTITHFTDSTSAVSSPSIISLVNLGINLVFANTLRHHEKSNLTE